jgi:hypothetical protein
VEKACDDQDGSDSEPMTSSEDFSKQRKIDQFFGARVSETASIASIASLSDAMSSSAIGASALRLSSKGLKKSDDPM